MFDPAEGDGSIFDTLTEAEQKSTAHSLFQQHLRRLPAHEPHDVPVDTQGKVRTFEHRLLVRISVSNSGQTETLVWMKALPVVPEVQQVFFNQIQDGVDPNPHIVALMQRKHGRNYKNKTENRGKCSDHGSSSTSVLCIRPPFTLKLLQ